VREEQLLEARLEQEIKNGSEHLTLFLDEWKRLRSMTAGGK
jgi:hypothetical protein